MARQKKCDLCGKKRHTHKRILAYGESFLSVNHEHNEYDVCDECSRMIDEAKKEQEFQIIKSIRDKYKIDKANSDREITEPEIDNIIDDTFDDSEDKFADEIIKETFDTEGKNEEIEGSVSNDGSGESTSGDKTNQNNTQTENSNSSDVHGSKEENNGNDGSRIQSILDADKRKGEITDKELDDIIDETFDDMF